MIKQARSDSPACTAYLDEQVVVKSKIESIWQANAVELLSLEMRQSLDHDGHFCNHANGV